jgi:hypothetical protein
MVTQRVCMEAWPQSSNATHPQQHSSTPAVRRHAAVTAADAWPPCSHHTKQQTWTFSTLTLTRRVAAPVPTTTIYNSSDTHSASNSTAASTQQQRRHWAAAHGTTARQGDNMGTHAPPPVRLTTTLVQHQQYAPHSHAGCAAQSRRGHTQPRALIEVMKHLITSMRQTQSHTCSCARVPSALPISVSSRGLQHTRADAAAAAAAAPGGKHSVRATCGEHKWLCGAVACRLR